MHFFSCRSNIAQSADVRSEFMNVGGLNVSMTSSRKSSPEVVPSSSDGPPFLELRIVKDMGKTHEHSQNAVIDYPCARANGEAVSDLKAKQSTDFWRRFSSFYRIDLENGVLAKRPRSAQAKNQTCWSMETSH